MRKGETWFGTDIVDWILGFTGETVGGKRLWIPFVYRCVIIMFFRRGRRGRRGRRIRRRNRRRGDMFDRQGGNYT